jgi:hypothetical protein
MDQSCGQVYSKGSTLEHEFLRDRFIMISRI